MTQPLPDSPLRQLFSRGAVYTSARALQLSASFLILPLITRLLGVEAFGTVATALIVLQISTWVFGLGLPSAVARFHFDGGDGPIDARFIAGIAIVAAPVLAVIAEATGAVWSTVFEDLEYGWVLRLAVWAAVPNVAVLAAQSQLLAKDKPKQFVGLALVTSVGAQILGLVGIIAIDATPEWYLAGLGFGYLIAGMWAIAIVRPQFRGSHATLRRALSLALPTVPHAMALLVLSTGDRIVIERIDDLAAVGRYQVAYAVGALTLAFIGALNNTWAPLIYRADPETRWSVLATTTNSIMAIAAITASGLALASPILLQIAAPAAFDPLDLVPVAAIVGATAVPYVAYLSRVHVLFQEKRSAPLAWITPFVALLNIILNFALIPRWGLLGAAVATIVGYSVLAMLVNRAAGRLVALSHNRSSILRASGATAAAVALASLMTSNPGANAAKFIVALGLLVYLVSRVRREIRATH